MRNWKHFSFFFFYSHEWISDKLDKPIISDFFLNWFRAKLYDLNCEWSYGSSFVSSSRFSLEIIVIMIIHIAIVSTNY